MSPELDLFVTGMARSGTTLLEKLLCGHPELSVLSQPFPFVFHDVKRRFLASLGAGDEALPLGTLFQERRYAPEDFDAFLAGHRLEAADLARSFAAMRGWSGRYTEAEPAPEALRALHGCDLADVVRGLDRALAHRPGARGFGSKEVLCEEFLPYLLRAGFRVLLVLRDPRDVLASMRGGRGESFTGPARPFLHDLRAWRRSAAYALLLGERPGCRVVRYEELVTAPLRVLGELARELGLAAWSDPIAGGSVRDQQGRPWRANSSHGGGHGIDAGSVGSHRRHLEPDEVRYVETLCFPEMRALGYAPGIAAPDLALLDRFVDRRVRRTGDVPPGLSARPAERRAERRRLAALCDGGPKDPAETVTLFRFESVAERLADALRG